MKPDPEGYGILAGFDSGR